MHSYSWYLFFFEVTLMIRSIKVSMIGSTPTLIPRHTFFTIYSSLRTRHTFLVNSEEVWYQDTPSVLPWYPDTGYVLPGYQGWSVQGLLHYSHPSLITRFVLLVSATRYTPNSASNRISTPPIRSSLICLRVHSSRNRMFFGLSDLLLFLVSATGIFGLRD